MPSVPPSLAWAHPLIQDWFVQKFGTPTEPQEQGWPHILAGRTTLISAPTGSGKTLAAFLACIDRLVRKALAGDLQNRTEVLYVSPLKALGNDIHRNLEGPLGEILQMAGERGLLMPEIRTAVRTGDTLMHERRAMLKRPPHILVTTPESLYILLTAEGSRAILRDVETVIVDEIHAVADDKRGAHLTLSLERLEALRSEAGGLSLEAIRFGRKPTVVRIGLSATQKPIEEVAHFLTGNGRPDPVIVNIGHERTLNLAVEVPGSQLGPIATNEMWEEIYDRLVELVHQNRSTLVFVNTRRLVERVAHHLAERMGEDNVAAHHGSLSRKLRLAAEKKLKEGQIKVLVATASLELGIDIGTVDLVVQISSPRAIAVALQRVGRSGHWRGAVPKGRFFVTTRDDLLECAALVRGIRRGELDRLMIPDAPLDILAQQIVATCATNHAARPPHSRAELEFIPETGQVDEIDSRAGMPATREEDDSGWDEDELFVLVKRAYPYRNLSRESYDAILEMLAEGIAARRGRYGAYLHRDRVNHKLRARRGSRLAAITSGGAIPETALFTVVAQPDGVVVGTLDEDFAVESNAGDIMLLGNSSWRIRRVEGKSGRVLVEDAHGAPPTVPFWRGEAPARTEELSFYVAELRQQISDRLAKIFPVGLSSAQPEVAETVSWLKEECGLDDAGAEQAIEYVLQGRAVLGAVPTQQTIIAERFFDEAGGMQLVIHAPFGARINKAWGLALRKRFCRSFNFELQAAATDNGLNIALAEQHSFPLADVFHLLTAETVPPVPSQFSHEILNANPYAYLDDAPLEERRARAVEMRRILPESVLEEVGKLDPEAIAQVRQEAWPDVRDADELHDVLHTLIALPQNALGQPISAEVSADEFIDAQPELSSALALVEVNRRASLDRTAEGGRLYANLADWRRHFERLFGQNRAGCARFDGRIYWVAAERVRSLTALFPGASFEPELPEIESSAPSRDDALLATVSGWMTHLGPATATELGDLLGLPSSDVEKALLRLEASGAVLRGRFTDSHTGEIEWCERRLLARIHRLTVATLRKQIEPVTAAQFMRWLLRWQHVAPGTQVLAERGLLEVLRQLQGFEIPASAWERHILARRVTNYDPKWLDQLCLNGAVGWGRLSPHPATLEDSSTGKRRVIPTSVAPITFFVREDADWMTSHNPAADQPEARSEERRVGKECRSR